MRSTAISRVPLAIRRLPVWFASVAFVVMLAGCGAFETATPTVAPTAVPTVSPDLLKIDAIETRMQDACDDFIRQQATLAAEGAYDLPIREVIVLPEDASSVRVDGANDSHEKEVTLFPDEALSLHVERAYSESLTVFDGMDADSPDADAARAMIARIAPMQRHTANWDHAFAAMIDMIVEGLLTEANVLTSGPMAEWRSRSVELCAEW